MRELLLMLALAVLVFTLLFFVTGCGENAPESVNDYHVAACRNTSYSTVKRMVCLVRVGSREDLSDSVLRKELVKIARHLWTERYMKWDEFTVFFYLPGMDVEDVAYSRVEFTSEGFKEFVLIEL